MLRPSRNDWPLLIALVALVLALLANFVAFSSAERSHPPQSQQAHTAADPVAPPQELKHEPWLVRAVDDPINLFTGVLALLTLFLVGFGGWQAWLTRKSIDLARDEFNTTHRPKIDICLIRLDRIMPGTDLLITWCAANNGDAPARIFDSNASIMFGREPLPAVPEYDARRADMNGEGKWIGPGVVGTSNKRFAVANWDWFSYEKDQQLSTPNAIDLFFFGYALYEARDGQKRSVAFCRRYNYVTKRFDTVRDPNYEHAA